MKCKMVEQTEEDFPEVPKEGWGKYAPVMQLHAYCMRIVIMTLDINVSENFENNH